YVAGDTSSSDFPTLNGLQNSLRGDTDAFVAKFDPSALGAEVFKYSTYFGGFEGPSDPTPEPDSEASLGIVVPAPDQVDIVGFTNAVDFPLSNPSQAQNNGEYDAFVAELNSGTRVPGPAPSCSPSADYAATELAGGIDPGTTLVPGS